MVCCVCDGPTDGICTNCADNAIERALPELKEKYGEKYGLTKEEFEDIWWTIYGSLGPWHYEW